MNIGTELGICVKDLEGRVLEQNDNCIGKCKYLVGEICNKGCMANYEKNSLKSFQNGMTLFKNIEVDNGLVDAVIINNQNTITTLLYDQGNRKNLIEEDIRELENCNLTKSEMVIINFVLNGLKNKEIMKKLFISEATLKTHLNNIYKKLPAKWQLLKNRK